MKDFSRCKIGSYFIGNRRGMPIGRKFFLVFSYGLVGILDCLLMSCAQFKHQFIAIQQSEQHELVGVWFDWGRTSTGHLKDEIWVFSDDHRFKIENQANTEILQTGEWQTHGDTLLIVYDTYSKHQYTSVVFVRSYVYSLSEKELTLSSIDDPHISRKLRLKR